MNNLSLYLICFVVPLILGLAVQGWLKSTFARNSQKAIASGKTGAEVAREILDRNGLSNVPVQTSKAGPLSDHYDPRGRTVNLSAPVFGGRSVAATAVAAHEVGHAIQHAKSYVPMTLRSAFWPGSSSSSSASSWAGSRTSRVERRRRPGGYL
jgi:Zn-dependent membrane protease YugP